MKDEFLREYRNSLANYLQVDLDDKYIEKWLDEKICDYRSNWFFLGIEVPCTLSNILDNIVMDMG